MTEVPLRTKKSALLSGISVSAFAENLLMLKHTLLHQSQRLLLEMNWFQAITGNKVPQHCYFNS